LVEGGNLADRVLIVEDEPIVAEVVERFLRHEGFETLIVGDGKRALADFDRFMPDVV
jgi:two-component system response regulator BaeR/two-component system response regulator AdeR